MEEENALFNSIKEKYLKVKDLIKANDEETNPYKSKNEAKDLLCEMKEILQKADGKIGETAVREIAMLAGVYYLMGSLFLASDETAAAEQYLLESYYLTEENSCHPDNVLCICACLNQIGLYYAQQQRNEEALNYLNKAVKIYETYSKNITREEPVTFITLFARIKPKEEKSGIIILEKTYTLTLYYLAQVYTALDDREKGAMYCHETLRRQVESEDYDFIDWAMNVATLSQFLIEKNAFKEARHHLAAAEYILNRYENKLDNDEELKGNNELLAAKKEELHHRRSDVLRCWVKYCFMLLSFSKDRLMNDDEKPLPVEEISEELKGLYFPSLTELNENIVTCEPILTFDDAKPVFLFGQLCCNQSTSYYTLTEHASDYANISMDHSQLYSYLAFFDDDEDRRCKLLKRRLDILKNVVKNLNPVYYIDICRQSWMILGQICLDMIDIKLKKVRSNNYTANQILKVNALVEEGISFYTSFINSFMDKRTQRMPNDYPKEHEQSIITAHLLAARLQTKYIQPDKQKSKELDLKSMEFYQKIVDYARVHKVVAQDMATEIKLAEEMLRFLPYKLNNSNQINIC